MTEEELKKYRKQIEALKKDFHKENPENIESKKISTKEILQNNIKSVTKESKEILKDIKQKEVAKDVKESVAETKNSFLDDLKGTETKEKTAESKDATKTVDIEKSEKTTSASITNDNTESIQFQDDLSADNEIKTEEETKDAAQNIPPDIDDNHEDESNFPFLKFLIILLLTILLAIIGYYFYSNYTKNKEIQAQNDKLEQLYKDSIQDYEISLQIDSESNASEYEENNTSTLISDTILNIESNNPSGYYAIIGSYSKLKNASILKTKQNTSFTSYIFEDSPIRIGLKLSDDDSEVFNDLNTIRKKYPEAWVLYNKN